MKLCINCMAKMRDEKEICPFCGCVQSEGVKSSYHLLPGKSKLQNGRYLVGKAVSWDQVHTTYIGWDFQRNCKVTIPGIYAYSYGNETAGSTADHM